MKHHRKKKIIPISNVRHRKDKLTEGIISRHRRRYYPLYETYQDIYNYENIRESILNWNEYSQNININVSKVCSLLNNIGENGTPFQINEATNIVINNILPYLKKPTLHSPSFMKLKNMNESKELILEKIREEAECDRVLENYDNLNNRFNIIKFFSEALNRYNFTTSIYKFCSLMETYKMDFKTKFVVTVENALYALSQLTQNVPTKLVIENVIDYFLINNKNDLNTFVEDIRDASYKDDFINDNIVNSYTDYILECNNTLENEKDYEDEFLNKTSDETYKLIEEYDVYKYMKGGLKALYEVTIADKANKLLMQFKCSPQKLISKAKEIIQTIFASSRLQQDIGKAVSKALNVSEYCGITMDVFGEDLVAVLLDTVKDCTNYISPDDSQYKNILDIWKNHYNNMRVTYEHMLDYDKQKKYEFYCLKLQEIIEEFETKLHRKEDEV